MCMLGHTAWTIADRNTNAEADDEGTVPEFPLRFPVAEKDCS